MARAVICFRISFLGIIRQQEDSVERRVNGPLQATGKSGNSSNRGELIIQGSPNPRSTAEFSDKVWVDKCTCTLGRLALVIIKSNTDIGRCLTLADMYVSWHRQPSSAIAHHNFESALPYSTQSETKDPKT